MLDWLLRDGVFRIRDDLLELLPHCAPNKRPGVFDCLWRANLNFGVEHLLPLDLFYRLVHICLEAMAPHDIVTAQGGRRESWRVFNIAVYQLAESNVTDRRHDARPGLVLCLYLCGRPFTLFRS